MACEDRQLTQAQRQAGFEQLRNAGVVQGVRPFSGRPTLENLADYINRELFPAVKRTREKVNDIYRPVTDNAPSANPLAYFFSDETANADPTAGRLRLNSATQNASTTVRISQTNGRLKDVAAWLDVMAGSATVPLGTLTLYHATDTGRFLRFDLTTMVDQGAYWDLGVTFVESSHVSPFLDADPVVLAFIPGVASSGAAVPPGSIGPIAADTFLGNITTSAAPAVAVPLASIDSASVIYDATSHTFQRAALTGDVTAPQDGNATTIANDAVSNAKLRNSGALSVIGRSANSTGDPADIATTSGSGAVLRESGGVLGFGTLATAGLADASVTLAKQADLAQSRIIGRAEGAGTGVPQALTPTQVIAIVDAETVTWTGSHSFNGSQFEVHATADALIGATSGIGLFAAHTPAGVGSGDIALNATGGIAIVSDPTTPVVAVAAGQIHVEGFGDVWASSTGGGVALSTQATHPTGVTNGLILFDSVGNVQINTAGTQRITFESDGSWNIGGSNGTSGHTIVSAGSAASPGWGQLGTVGIADAAITLAKQANLAQSTIIGRAEGAGTGVPTALTPTQVVSIIDGEAVTWAVIQTFSGSIIANATIQANGPVAFNGVLTTSSTSITDLDIGQASAVRFTGANVALHGMIPSTNHHLVLLANATSSTTGTTLQIFTEGLTEGTASRRFAGPTTSINIERGRAAWAWYDETSSRWRVVAGPNAV